MSNKDNEVVEDVQDQAVPDDPVNEEAAGELLEHAELGALLEDARDKADEHWNQCMHLQADIENLRKRAERDLANARKYALERFSQELLPVRDSLEMGLSAFAEDNAHQDKLSEGVELTLQMLTSALEKFGITEVDPLGEPFNPEFHQAISMQERDDVAPNTVVTVVQKGYLLHVRLIRPAMVIVSKASGKA
ncbi:MAG: nucleotide exchange factor GrpE [Pseudomonadota bacterium]|nr:nucleotide exchange factor GrpE [Pseudomonadota bacterium]